MDHLSPEDRQAVVQSLPQLAAVLRTALTEWNDGHPWHERAEFQYPAAQMVAAVGALVWCLEKLAALKNLDAVTLGERAEARAETLALLAELKKACEGADYCASRTIDLVIWRGRELGMSWRELGEALGMSGQGAYKRAKQLGVDITDEGPSDE